jgi:hypothetical protein
MKEKTCINNRYQPLASGWMSLVLLVVPMSICHGQTPPTLHTPAPTFATTNRYVTTVVFHWYTPTAGQLSGPWRPPEGRDKWTGEPEWWKGQIKQIMSANIDVLYVHLIPNWEAQRINLFKALDELRAEGYDTPKVAPFLDPLIIWNNQPAVNLATQAGKDEFVSHYIRFFQQYFAASAGNYADDYLARQAGKPILSTWHVHLNCSNVASLTRADVSNRFSAVFAGDHPYFTNGFVMVTTALSPTTLSFADEKSPQFEINQHYYHATFNSIRTVQLKGGYWDQNIRNPGDFLARNGGVNYSNAWNQVDRAATRRVYIESWNEFDEGTGIYAAQNSPYLAPANTSGNTDVWSTTGDPFEYIKTTARGAAVFNDTPALGAKILWHNIPATLTPGETRTVSIIIRNTGDESWTAAGSFKLGQGDADATFVTGKRVLLDDSKDEIPIYGGIFRGRAKAFQATLAAPAALGNYTTHWRMLQEGGTWFGEELLVPIEVKTKTAATVTLSNLSQVYDGTPRSVSATPTPPGLTVDLTYDGSPYPPTGVGSYAVVGTIDDSVYQGSATATLVIAADPNLVAAAGGFEFQTAGASYTSPPNLVDVVTFPGWRIFNLVSASVALNATIIGNASTGSKAMRLVVNNTGGASNYALDQWQPNMHTPVQQAANYLVSFDAAWIAGATTNNVVFQVQEFDAAGGYLTNGLSVTRSVSATNYQTFTFLYRATRPDAAKVGLYFSPMRGVVGTTTISIDNIRLVPASLAFNGDFELSPISTSAGGAGMVVNTTAFLGWRLFSVGSPPITGLTGTVVDAGNYVGGQPGSHAIRLDVNNTGSPTGHDYGLDNNNARTPVTTGKKYTLSFDVELDGIVGGPLALNALIAEFNAAGGFTGTQGGFTPSLPTDQTFHRYSMNYVVTNPATTQVVISFRPVTTGRSTVVIDNVIFAPFINPTPTQITFNRNGSAVNLAWPESHLGWLLQSNSANVVAAGNWFDLPGTDATTNKTIIIDPAKPAVFYRLRLP